ncbi:MAG TPA: adenylate/guanylate cyclase domain-containing protein [Candidatus Obscuribacterales bacterium]
MYSKFFAKVPIRVAIVVPFLIQIVGVVGLTGWLSFRNGQKSVNNLASELSSKISDGIEAQVQNYLKPPLLLHHVTASAIRSGNLDLDDFSKLQGYLWNEVEQQTPETTFQFGNQKGEYVGVRKIDDGTILLLLDKSKTLEREIYVLDKQGKPIRLIRREKYDPRTRPWYKNAVVARKTTWTPIYLSLDAQSVLLISAVKPIYNQTDRLRGVFGFEIALKQISDFLRGLEISKSGEAFIIERSGEIVASSAAESPFITDGKKQKRLQATNSSNPLIQATAKHLLQKFGSFKQLNTRQHFNFSFDIDGNRQLVHVDPIDDLGLDWLVVVVIPQADFMENIKANRLHTVLLCLVSLIVAILFGLRTSKSIVKPIFGLNTAAKKLSEGEWEQKLPVERNDEIGELAKSFNSMTEQLKESFATLEDKVRDRTAELALANEDLEIKNALIRKVFGRYLTNEVVANLLENPENLKLGGERRKITIVTSDLRGFTATSERLPPEEVVKILNFYLHNMADAIGKYYGTIDEFMGDGILILFGAPTVREDDAVRAVACAVEMQLAMVPVNEKMKEWGLPPLEMGIGINTGEVVVGNIGSEKRTKYGIVGSHVNLTYRIESYTVGGQIFISESTLKEAGSIVRIVSEKHVQPKGVQEPITIYEVGGIGGEYNLFLTKEEQLFFSLPEPMPIQYMVIDGKHISDTLFKGSLVKLSAKEALISCYNGESYGVPFPLSNIKLNLLTLFNAAEDIYAKVLEKSADNGSFYIHFTSKSPTVQARLDALYKSLEATG